MPADGDLVVLEQLRLGIELAEHGVAGLVGQQQPGIAVLRRRDDGEGRVEHRAEPDDVEQLAGLGRDRAAARPGLLDVGAARHVHAVAEVAAGLDVELGIAQEGRRVLPLFPQLGEQR